MKRNYTKPNIVVILSQSNIVTVSNETEFVPDPMNAEIEGI